MAPGLAPCSQRLPSKAWGRRPWSVGIPSPPRFAHCCCCSRRLLLPPLTSSPWSLFEGFSPESTSLIPWPSCPSSSSSPSISLFELPSCLLLLAFVGLLPLLGDFSTLSTRRRHPSDCKPIPGAPLKGAVHSWRVGFHPHPVFLSSPRDKDVLSSAAQGEKSPTLPLPRRCFPKEGG